jgi:hypothetical protein
MKIMVKFLLFVQVPAKTDLIGVTPAPARHDADRVPADPSSAIRLSHLIGIDSSVAL